VIFLNVSAGADNVAGKGVICECTDCATPTRKQGYLFMALDLQFYRFDQQGDTIRQSGGDVINNVYRTQEKLWWLRKSEGQTLQEVLDRKTLDLDVGLNGTIVETWSCDLYQNKSYFFVELGKLREEYQADWNDGLKGNQL